MSRKRKEIVKFQNDKVIVVKGKNGREDSIIHVEPEKCGTPRIVRSGFQEYRDITPTFSRETYLERLCSDLEKSVEENDKLIVAEAFKKNRVTISYQKYKVLDSIRMFFGKKPKNPPILKRLYLGREGL